MRNKNIPFWLLTISVFIALIVPVLIRDGMFMDGMLYTCVAKNLGNGTGTFWKPIFSATYNTSGVSSFHEHPQLIFGIQALFFKVLGNSMYVERFYSFLTACITLLLIVKVWNRINTDKEDLKRVGWLPVLFWIIIPVCYWSYQNNMQENTMGIFTLLSVYFSIEALMRSSKKIVFVVFAGIFIFLASFSKGVPGIFPLMVPVLYWIVFRRISFARMTVYSLILTGVPVLIYGLMLLHPEARESFSFYLEQRLMGRIESAHTVDYRLYTLVRLLQELIPVFILITISMGLIRIKHIDPGLTPERKKTIIFFLLIGCAGSLPLMLTMVQKGFYFVHSLPFFAIGLALIVAPGLSKLITSVKPYGKTYKIFLSVTVLLLLAVITYSFIQTGKISRNHDLLHDVYMIGEIIPDGSIVKIEPEMWDEWDLQCYLIRYFNISLDKSVSDRTYYLVNRSLDSVNAAGYEKLDLETKQYDLYCKTE